jgi:phage baseplate assembly protein W
MSYTVTANIAEINLTPETVDEEVIQNVAMILATPQFSVPLDRGLGLSQRFIDKPLPAAQALIIAEIIDAVETYEPRVTVENVYFEQGETSGKMIPYVEVSINGG